MNEPPTNDADARLAAAQQRMMSSIEELQGYTLDLESQLSENRAAAAQLQDETERANRRGERGRDWQILQSRMQLNLGYEITGFSNMVNYGSDRLRFPSPVPAGATIHSRARVKRVEQVKSGTQLTLELNTHVLGSERPSVINELVILYM